MLVIVIPYYKLTFFEATLQSLADQTDKRFKVYIGDDASPENPSSLLEKYIGKFDFVYHRFETNLGGISLTQQWERCIALSGNEEWIMILGDDDVLGENVVEEFFNEVHDVENENINVIRFSTQKINDKGDSISNINKNAKIEKAFNFLFNKKRSSLSEYVFKKAQVISKGFYDFPLAWYSDVLAVFEFSNYQNLFSINNSIVYIRISDLSISGDYLNIISKQHAEFEFYYYLLNYRSSFFSEKELKELYFRIGKCYINNKKRWTYFFRITKLFSKKKLIKEYLIFLKRIILLTVKKN